MKKNKLTASLIMLFVMLVPLNFAFLEIEKFEGAISLIMMILFEFLVMGALIIGINKD